MMRQPDPLAAHPDAITDEVACGDPRLRRERRRRHCGADAGVAALTPADAVAVDEPDSWPPGSLRLARPDPLVLALARYVQALHHRYPKGPKQLRRQGLAARANMPDVLHPKDPAT
jgi:hypothetical protein